MYRHGSVTLPSEFMAEANAKEEFIIYSDHHLHLSKHQLFFPSVIPIYCNCHYSLRLLKFESNCGFSCKCPTWAQGCIWNCLTETTFRQSRNESGGYLFVPLFCHLHFSSKGANWFCPWSLSIMKSPWKYTKNAWNILVDGVLFWFDYKALLLLWISGRQEECSSFSLFQTSRRGLAHCCLPQVKKRHLVFINENDFHHYLHKEQGREIQSQMITGDVCEDAYYYSEGTHTLRAVHMVTEDGLYNQVGTGTERHDLPWTSGAGRPLSIAGKILMVTWQSDKVLCIY